MNNSPSRVLAPAQNRISLPRLLSLLAGVAVLVLVPIDLIKFLGLGWGVWAAGGLGTGNRRWWAWVALITLAFAGAFLVNPLASAPFLRPAGISAAAATSFWQGLFLLLGCLWLWVALRGTGPTRASWSWSEGMFVATWLLLLVALYAGAWGNDVSYGGDEHFHMASAIVHGALVRHLCSRALPVVLFAGWLGAGAALACALKQNRASGSRYLSIWAMGGLVAAALAALYGYPRLEELHPAIHERTIRYPAAQPWASALIGIAASGWTGAQSIFSFELLRFLPMVALFLLGVFLAKDPRWRYVGFAPRLLGLGVVATIPTLLYHGTMLYLELPAVLLLVGLLAGSKRWLAGSPASLRRQPIWWVSILLGFAKDTTIVAAGLLLLGRWAARGRHRWMPPPVPRTGRRGTSLREEAGVALAVLGPGLLYLLLRHAHDHRPYQLHLENLASGQMWLTSVRSLLTQFGCLWGPAWVGVWVLWRRRGRAVLLLNGSLLAGLWALHFLEDPQWVGFARFNLLLLPPVLVVAWEGLTWMAALHASRGAWLCAGLTAGNLLLSPVSLDGQRSAWGNSGERWYDFSACLSDIRRASPDCTLLLGNMDQPYAIALVTSRLGWKPRYSTNLPCPPGLTGQAALEETLRVAAERAADYVIYRVEGALPVRLGDHVGNYLLDRNYPARVGGLLLFRRTGG